MVLLAMSMASTAVKIINTGHLGFLPSAWTDPCVDPGPDPERGGICMEDDVDDNGRSAGLGGASWEVGGMGDGCGELLECRSIKFFKSQKKHNQKLTSPLNYRTLHNIPPASMGDNVLL